MRVLLDTNVVLDFILDRPPFAQTATQLFELHEQGSLDIFIAAVTLVNVFYITRKNQNVDRARQAVNELLATTGICPLDQAILQDAQQLGFDDYEDAVQHASAVALALEAIVTRDPRGFHASRIPVFTPEQCVQRINARQ